MNRWMTSEFMSFSTVFHSYQNDGRGGDNERLYRKESGLPLKRYPPQAELEPGTAVSVGQLLTH